MLGAVTPVQGPGPVQVEDFICPSWVLPRSFPAARLVDCVEHVRVTLSSRWRELYTQPSVLRGQGGTGRIGLRFGVTVLTFANCSGHHVTWFCTVSRAVATGSPVDGAHGHSCSVTARPLKTFMKTLTVGFFERRCFQEAEVLGAIGEKK